MQLHKEGIKKLLQEAFARRGQLGPVTNAMRLVNGPGDHLPGLLLDRYDRHFQAQVFDLSWLEHINVLTDVLQQKFKAQYFIIKDRTGSKEAKPDDIRIQVPIEKTASTAIVREYGLIWQVDLNDTLNTGLFLDMRANRNIVGRLAQGRRVLNCFAYTCSFGAHCRMHQSREVTNVDISSKALEAGRMNYALNKIQPAQDEFVRAEAGWYLSRAIKKTNCFDAIILDPPSFSRHETKTFAVKRDLAGLITASMHILSPDGVLFVSTNWSDLKHKDLITMITQAAGKRKIKNIQQLGQDSDFPGSGSFKESHLSAVLARVA